MGKSACLAALLLAVAVVSYPRAALAAEAVAQAEQPPHYVGEPVLIRVRAAGFEEEPEPACTPEKDVEGIELQTLGASPNVSSMVRIFNGRRSEERSVTWSFDFYATPQEAGDYILGPFTIRQGGRSARTGVVRISPREIPIDPGMSIRLNLPSGPVFPGQRVSLEIEWAYAGNVQAVDDLTIRSLLFDRFTFEDEAPVRGDPLLPLTTVKGVIRLKATVQEEDREGKRWVVLRSKRTFMPTEPGVHDLGRITAHMNKVTRWQRTMFGDRVPSAVERVRAQGDSVRLEVKDLPREGRPESFAGAIGKGLSFEASADRTVVRVGDPITLTLVLRGDTNLETAGLPSLTADGGLDPAAFRLSEGDVAGTVGDGVKTFRVRVRVEDPTVAQIPALAYSYFDSQAGAYRTVRSDPIALQVDDAEVVSARDVVSGAPAPSAADSVRPPPTPASRQRFDVTGADLSIASDAEHALESERSRFGGRPLRIALYALGGLAILLALWGRRRADIDPELVRRRSLLSAQRSLLEQAPSRGGGEGARVAAAALRAIAPEVSSPLKAELERAAAAFDEAAYRPGLTAGPQFDERLFERARSLMDRAAAEVA